jgi:hypothetical protein
MTHKDLKEKIEATEKKYDYQLKIVFDNIKQLLEPLEQPSPISMYLKHSCKGNNFWLQCGIPVIKS